MGTVVVDTVAVTVQKVTWSTCHTHTIFIIDIRKIMVDGRSPNDRRFSVCSHKKAVEHQFKLSKLTSLGL